jgi:hypothetical protein
MNFARSQLSLGADESSVGAPVTALMTVRTLLRIVHHELDLPDVNGLGRELVATLAGSSKQQVEDLRAETGRAARVLAEHQRWPAAYELLAAYEAIGLVLRSQTTDQWTQLRLFYDGLFTAAIVHGWGEYHRRTDHVRVVGQYVQRAYADLDVLAEASGKHQLTPFGIPTVIHHQWAQPLTIAAHELEDHPVFDGGIGYSLEKDHPSSLFSGSHLLGTGPQDCLEHLLDAVIEDREAIRAALLNTLVSLIDKRGQA